MNVGVLDVQGDVTEHVKALEEAAKAIGYKVRVEPVRSCQSIRCVDAIVIPGGESTTVSRLLSEFGLDEELRRLASDKPVFGTCAGLVLLSKQGSNMKSGQRQLGMLDARVKRNAFGRQIDSFEADLEVEGLDGGPFPGVFIRAPAVEKVWGNCKSLCIYRGKTVLVRQDNILASAFHPELTEDTRLHELFLEMI